MAQNRRVNPSVSELACCTVLLYYCIIVLLYYCITVLLYSCITVLLYYYITVLLYYWITGFPHYWITVLLDSRITGHTKTERTKQEQSDGAK